MNRDAFTATAIALLRTAIGWQSAIARRLGVEPRTVRRWLKTGEVPEWVEGKLAELIGAREEAGPWPRDEWMIGDGVTDGRRQREYIVHLAPPRFIARIVAVDEDGEPEPDERPVDVLSGLVYSSDPYLLCEIAWIDPPPSAGHLTALFEAAADAVDAASGLDGA